ncbi:MAG: AtpZ/AtpI family protein [Candidatus Paceibacterota bacterium]
MINEDKNNLNNDLPASPSGLPRNGGGPWWKPAMQIFSEVSTWIVVPVVLALIFGKMLDAHYGTKPIIFLSLTGVAFLFSCFKIFYVVKDYMKKLQDIDKK